MRRFLLEACSDLMPHTLDTSDKFVHQPIPGPPDGVRPIIDSVCPDAVLVVHDDAEGENSSDDGRKSRTRGDHKHDHHLQPRGLLHRRASENGSRHHTRNRDNSKYAAGGRLALVNVGRKEKPQSAYLI